MTDSMLGWHFLAEDRRLLYGSKEIVEAGQTYTASGPLVMCQNGMHACKRPIDALPYAPGPIVCRVRLRGEMIHDTIKSVARSRQVLWMADATGLLHEFAFSIATHALLSAEAQHILVCPESWQALTVKTRWLKGQATDKELDAARAAARAAAGAATRAAARDAAGAAAGDAAWDAAWVAARAATRAAARAAAGAAAWAAAWAALNLQLETMLDSLGGAS